MTQRNTDALIELMNSQTIIGCEKHWRAVLETDDFDGWQADRVLDDVCHAICDKLESLIYSDATQTIDFIQELMGFLINQESLEVTEDDTQHQDGIPNHCSVLDTGSGLNPCES